MSVSKGVRVVHATEVGHHHAAAALVANVDVGVVVGHVVAGGHGDVVVGRRVGANSAQHHVVAVAAANVAVPAETVGGKVAVVVKGNASELGRDQGGHQAQRRNRDLHVQTRENLCRI